MNEATIEAFKDELEKIAKLPGILKMKYLKYPLIAGGGILGWEQLKKMKRRYDIGSAVEDQMSARGQ